MWCLRNYPRLLRALAKTIYIEIFMRLNQFDVDAAIVDLDGTMIDTLDDFCAALNGMLAELPAPFATQRVDRQQVSNLVGKGSEHLITCILDLADNKSSATNSGVSKQSPDEVHALYEQAWSSYQDKATSFL